MKACLIIAATLIALTGCAAQDSQKTKVATEDMRKAREYCSGQYTIGDPSFNQCMASQVAN